MRRNFVDEAILNAEKSNMKVANHGAVIIYRGKIVGHGYNKYCVQNKNKINHWSVHAEVDAINDALRKISHDDLRKSTLIVVRKLKEGTKVQEDNNTITKSESLICENIGNSMPCKYCTKFIIKYGIKTCYYS